MLTNVMTILKRPDLPFGLSYAYCSHKDIYLTINPNVREVVTDEAVFSLRFSFVIVDEENPDDEGLWGMWIGTTDHENNSKKEVQIGTPYLGRGE